MNRNQSLITARIALIVALAVVFVAVVVPLPQPPRPVVAARYAKPSRESPKDVVQDSQFASRVGIPEGASAPRVAARDRGASGSGTSLFHATRAPSHDNPDIDARPTPLEPIPDSRPHETLPPPPRDADIPRKAVAGPRDPLIELGPIDDTRARTRAAPHDATRELSDLEQRQDRVNVLLDRQARQAGGPDPAVLARLEAQIQAMQQQVDLLARARVHLSDEQSRQTTQILERMERMISMAEMQRKLDALEATVTVSNRAGSTTNVVRPDESQPVVTPAAEPAADENEAAGEREPTKDAHRGSANQLPRVGNDSRLSTQPMPDDSELPKAEPIESGTTETPPSASESDSDSATSTDPALPRIHPGPPFARTPAERKPSATTAPAVRTNPTVLPRSAMPSPPAALRSKPDPARSLEYVGNEGDTVEPTRVTAGGLTTLPVTRVVHEHPADTVASHASTQKPFIASRTPAAPKDRAAQSIPDAQAGGTSESQTPSPQPTSTSGTLVPEMAADEEEAIEAPSRETACYEHQLAMKCFARGDFVLARLHVRKAIAHDPKMISARELSDQIESALAAQTPNQQRARQESPTLARPAALAPVRGTKRTLGPRRTENAPSTAQAQTP